MISCPCPGIRYTKAGVRHPIFLKKRLRLSRSRRRFGIAYTAACRVPLRSKALFQHSLPCAVAKQGTASAPLGVCASEAERTASAPLGVCASEARHCFSTACRVPLRSKALFSAPLGVCASEAERTASVEDLSSLVDVAVVFLEAADFETPEFDLVADSVDGGFRARDGRGDRDAGCDGFRPHA